jgi:hypothetical protein
MEKQKQDRCAHLPCMCEVKPDQKYCGDTCRDAGSEEVEIACECNHEVCQLTKKASDFS